MRSKQLFLLLLMFVSLLPLGVAASEHSGAKRYKVSACDWMMLKRQKLGAVTRASEIGADGLVVDMGPLGNRVRFESKLGDRQFVRNFLHTADSLHIGISSVGMSGFYAQSFLKRANYVSLIRQCLDACQTLQTNVAFLPLGGCGNTWQAQGADPDSLVARLHVAGAMAKKAGVVIGIRTALSAEANLQLLKEVKSKGIKIFYSFQDAVDNHRDICHELTLLGRKNIVQILATNTDGVNLIDDKAIDMLQVRHTLDAMKWKGWLVLERSRDAQRVRDVVYNFKRNACYLHTVFK